MKVMVDTNVILSAILHRDSIPSQVLFFIVENEELVLCQTVLDECFEVAKRRFPTKVDVLRKLFSEMHFLNIPDAKNIQMTMPDVHDQPILNSAIENQVDILITGDHHFLELPCTKPEILSPRSYFDKFVK